MMPTATTPIGCSPASKATAIAVYPHPGDRPSYRANVRPETSIAPASPASAPEARNVTRITLFPSIRPVIRAAAGLWPTARSLKPNTVPLSTNHSATPSNTATAKPTWSRVPGIRAGSRAAAASASVWGKTPRDSWSGPCTM